MIKVTLALLVSTFLLSVDTYSDMPPGPGGPGPFSSVARNGFR